MVMLSIRAAPAHLRGTLSRYLQEVGTGLYVGVLSARLRERIWTLVEAALEDGSAVLAYSDKKEQGYTLRIVGDPHRQLVDRDGFQTIRLV